jgi:hypothetical protein
VYTPAPATEVPATEAPATTTTEAATEAPTTLPPPPPTTEAPTTLPPPPPTTEAPTTLPPPPPTTEAPAPPPPALYQPTYVVAEENGPSNYEFQYGVSDVLAGINLGHNENSNGKPATLTLVRKLTIKSVKITTCIKWQKYSIYDLYPNFSFLISC